MRPPRKTCMDELRQSLLEWVYYMARAYIQSAEVPVVEEKVIACFKALVDAVHAVDANDDMTRV